MTKRITWIGVFLFVIVFWGSIIYAFAYKGPRQIKADEICVNYICYQGNVNASITYLPDGFMELTVSRDGKNLVIGILQETYMTGRYFYKFRAQRGFMSVGENDRNAFIYLDGDYITLHITHSTFKQN